MADTAATVDALSSLPFGKYDDDWVKTTWEKDFTDIDPLPLTLEDDLQENNYYTQTLLKVCDVFNQWVREKEGADGEGFWTVLVENDLSFKSFTAFLAYLMELGHRKVANVEQREAGLLAASAYFKLVTVPGSGAFKVFHPMLFQRGLDMLKSWTTLGASKRKRHSSVRSSQPTKKGGGGKRARQSSTVQHAVNEFSDEEDEDDPGMLTIPEINRIKNRIISLLKDFIQLLENFSLNQSESSGHYSILVLAELTKQEPELFNGDFERPSLVGMSMPGLAYRALLKLFSPAHGDIVALATSVFKYLLPNILMLIGDNKGVAAQNIPREILTIKDQAVNFVCYLMKQSDDNTLGVVRILVQHMCAKVPDKAEYRAKVSQSIIQITKQFPAAQYASMIEWIYKYSRNGKNSYRAFAVDVLNLLLLEPEIPQGDVPEEQKKFLTHKFLVEIILARCSDLGPTVRARAISSFSQCLSSGNASILGAVRDLVTPKPSTVGNPPRLIPTPDLPRVQQLTEQTEGEPPTDGQPPTDAEEPGNEVTSLEPSPVPEGAADTPGIGKATATPTGANRDTPVALVFQTPELNFSLQDNQGVISMLRRRASDEKVIVRKSALQALENVIRLDSPCYKIQDVEVLKDRCRDPALSVRRQAMQSITDLLLNRPDDKQLQYTWLDGVLPMVMDRETTAQERCLEILEEIILRNVVPFHRSNEGSHRLVWDLLDIMAGDKGAELRRFLQKACQHWSRRGKLKSSIINSLQSHVGKENNAGAWLLLSELSPSCSKFNHEFVVEYWKNSASNSQASNYSTCQRVLVVMGSISKSLSSSDRLELIEDLKTKLLRFDFPPELIAATVNTLSKLCDTEGEDWSQKEEWFTELLMACDTYLSDLILNESRADFRDEDRVVRHLFTLGEIAQLCPANTPKRVFMLVQSLIAAPCLHSQDSIGSKQDQGSINEETPDTQSPQTSQTSETSPGTLASQTSPDIVGSEGSQGKQSSQGATQSSQTFQGTQVLSQFRGSKMSTKIRAHAFVTLGKLCLQNEDVAKKCVAALARELETSPDPAIRNNVVVIMCDLCVRYTTLVDRYVVNIASCLKDQSALVRKQTLTLLTRLLQEDFLKWKGVLFYRFITSLLDDNKEIREFSEFCLVHLLLQRNPNMFFHHFVECVFHFNAFDDHSVYNKFQQSEREKQMFSLKGKVNASKRLRLYTFMLEHMADDQRFKLTAKLCQDLLGGVVDNIIALNTDSSILLEDALSILCCKEIKLASLKVRPHDDVMDEQDMAAVVMATAKKTLITQVVKKNVIENIVPIVTSLKHLLEQHRSPVLKHLMMYLRELMKDYKDEVQEILSADRQLANEIEFDMRKFEEQEEEQERLRQSGRNSLTGSPNVAQSPKSGAGSPRTGAGSPRTNTCSPSSKLTSPKSVSNSTTASTGGSPQGQNPAISGSQGQRSPSTAPPSTPAPTTASKRMSLSTMAILNSAKKAMAKVKHVKEVRSTPARKTHPQRDSSPKPAEEPTEEAESESVEAEVPDDARVTPPVATLFKTPDNSAQNKRAISTPSGVLGNITFHQDQNITLMPPSPIPSAMPMRVYGVTRASTDSSPSLTPKLPCGPLRESAPDTDVVYMFSPDQPLPKPRTWNIKSTPPKTKDGAAKGATAGAAEETENVVQTKESPNRQSSSRSSRRSYRLNYS